MHQGELCTLAHSSQETAELGSQPTILSSEANQHGVGQSTLLNAIMGGIIVPKLSNSLTSAGVHFARDVQTTVSALQ